MVISGSSGLLCYVTWGEGVVAVQWQYGSPVVDDKVTSLLPVRLPAPGITHVIKTSPFFGEVSVFASSLRMKLAPVSPTVLSAEKRRHAGP